MEVASPVPVAVGLIVGVASESSLPGKHLVNVVGAGSDHEPCPGQPAYCFKSLTPGQILAIPLFQIHGTLFHCYKLTIHETNKDCSSLSINALQFLLRYHFVEIVILSNLYKERFPAYNDAQYNPRQASLMCM